MARDASGGTLSFSQRCLDLISGTSSDRRVGDPRNFKQNTTCRTKHLCIQMLFQQGKQAAAAENET
jgi:hypothetical protein